MIRFVVLVHGLGRTKYSMQLLKNFLENQTIAPSKFKVLNFGYQSRSYSIEDLSQKLKNYIQENLAPFANEQCQLNFVGHSLGCMLIRNFLSQNNKALDRNVSIARSVFLGPPNQGSALGSWVFKHIPFAKIIFGPALQDIIHNKIANPSAEFEIAVIAGGNGKSGYNPFFSKDNDGIVLVEECKLTGAKELIVVKAIHTFMMHKRQVQELILNFLVNGKFAN